MADVLIAATIVTMVWVIAPARRKLSHALNTKVVAGHIAQGIRTGASRMATAVWNFATIMMPAPMTPLRSRITAQTRQVALPTSQSRGWTPLVTGVIKSSRPLTPSVVSRPVSFNA
jgi:hypothetical protein